MTDRENFLTEAYKAKITNKANMK